MADEFGVDISEHKPRPVNLLALEDFDVIVSLDQYVKKRLLDQDPSLADELICWNVDDPYLKEIEQYRECARSLEAKLVKLVADLKTARAL